MDQDKPRRRRGTAGRAKQDKTPSARLPCIVWAYFPCERFSHVECGDFSCQNPKGEANIQNVRSHLIKEHLHICRRCKEPMVHEDGGSLNSVVRFQDARSYHGECDEKPWPEGVEQKNPPLLDESQEKTVLDLNNSWRNFELQRHEEESDQCFQWRQFFKALYPHVLIDQIPPPNYRPFNMPRYQHELAMKQRDIEAQQLADNVERLTFENQALALENERLKITDESIPGYNWPREIDLEAIDDKDHQGRPCSALITRSESTQPPALCADEYLAATVETHGDDPNLKSMFKQITHQQALELSAHGSEAALSDSAYSSLPANNPQMPAGEEVKYIHPGLLMHSPPSPIVPHNRGTHQWSSNTSQDSESIGLSFDDSLEIGIGYCGGSPRG